LNELTIVGRLAPIPGTCQVCFFSPCIVSVINQPSTFSKDIDDVHFIKPYLIAVKREKGKITRGWFIFVGFHVSVGRRLEVRQIRTRYPLNIIALKILFPQLKPRNHMRPDDSSHWRDDHREDSGTSSSRRIRCRCRYPAPNETEIEPVIPTIPTTTDKHKKKLP
jgi:hypothetical protein